MNKIIDYLKVIGFYFLLLIIYLLFISIFNYFEIISYKVINIITYIYLLIIGALSGIKISRKVRKKGYLNGFIIGITIVLLFTIITLIMKEFSFSTLVYYLTLILSTIIGGIIGIPKN